MLKIINSGKTGLNPSSNWIHVSIKIYSKFVKQENDEFLEVGFIY